MVFLGPGHGLVQHAPGRGPDRGKGSAEVVRDGIEQRGLEVVASASDLGAGPLERYVVADHRLP